MSVDPAIHPEAPAAAAALRADPFFAAVIERLGPCRMPAPHGREPFEALLRAIAHQQLHGKAAEAILGRFIALFPGSPFPTSAHVLAADPTRFRAAGLSASKIAAILDLCTRHSAGEVPNLAVATKMSNEELIASLIKIRGIGRWTVEMLLIFGLGRSDILPVDDFGVREGYRKAARLDTQPKPAALAAIGAAWAPWRSFASWYLWQAAAVQWNP
jgi:DNA-3-methyladenine glycosylase II